MTRILHRDWLIRMVFSASTGALMGGFLGLASAAGTLGDKC